MTPPRHRRPGRTAASWRISSSLAASLRASSYEQFGPRVRARLDMGLHQDALGQRVGLERSPISNIEKGRQKPAPAFRILAGRVQFRDPGAAPVDALDPDNIVPSPDRDRDSLVRGARVAISDTVTEKLAYQQFRVIPAQVPRPSTAPTNARAAHAPSAVRPWPSVKQPTVRTDRAGARIPSDIRPWTPRHSGPQRYKVTPRDKAKTARIAENSQLAGRFRRWWQVLWQVLGSNQRRLSRRFYSPSLLAGVHATDQHIRRPRRHPAPPPSAMRPWAPGLVHGRGRKNPRTGAVGTVTPTVRPASCL